MREQVLGAARQLVDAGPFQAGAEAAGKAGPEVAPVQRDAREARILHRRQQFAARRFDFGQFRQSLEHTGNRPQRALAATHMLPSRFQAHSWRRLQMPSAARSASAPIVDVGLTAALVVNELPSTTKRFGTSCD